MTPACYAPGPWHRVGRLIQSVDHGKWYAVAWVSDDSFTPEAIAANGALIAAAPDLHQALVEILRDYTAGMAVMRPTTHRKVLGAIAKASGGRHAPEA